MADHLNLLQNQRFLNNSSIANVEALLGLVSANPELALFDFAKVIVRRDYANVEEVKIVSGGPSGHEPSFIGFVGKGMLTASIQGDIYTSPSHTDILRTFEELSNERCLGILVVVPNLSGDRLNFGLAVERAQNLGMRVRMVLVSDDCHSFEKPKDKRGLSGALMVQKVAGALSEKGKTLDDIYNFCQEMQKEIFSLNVSVKPCTSTDKGICPTCRNVVGKTEMEIGAGLHGERGKFQMSLTAVEHVCRMVFEQMLDENNQHHLKIEPEFPLVVFINNLGTTSKMEEYIFTKEIVKYLKEKDAKVIRIYCDRFMTSINMYGFTVSILKVKNPEIVELLDAECSAPSWTKPTVITTFPVNFILGNKTKTADAVELRGPRLNKRQANTLLLVVQFACDALISCEKQLNQMDSEVGDGDCGTKFRKVAEQVNSSLANINCNFPFTTLTSIGEIVQNNSGGVLGCTYGIMFEAAAKEFTIFSENYIVGAWDWLRALKRALMAMIT